MSESYLRTHEAVEQEDAATWLAENYFFGEDIGEANWTGVNEAIEQEDAATWLAENGFFGEDIGEADWTNYLKNVGTGAALGIVTGGPVGLVTGAGTAAYQTYQQPKAQPSAPQPQPARPTAPPLAPVAAPVSVATPAPAVVTTPGPAMTAALPQAAGSPQVASPELSKQVERVLGEVLPKLLQQFLAQQSHQGVAKEAIAEDIYGEIEGDYLADDVFPTHFEGCGIGEPLPVEDRLQVY